MGTDTECYCVSCEGLAVGDIETLWETTMNCRPDTLAKQKIHALCMIYVHTLLQIMKVFAS